LFDTATLQLLGEVDDSGASYSRLATQLGEDINSGVFGSNDRLKVRDLAKRYGVSPSPVREALQILQGQGLIEIDANKGARVRRLDAAGINHVCEINQALESFAARVLAMSASQHQLQVLEEIDKRHRESCAAEDWEAFGDANRDFHFTVYKFIRNPFVTRSAVLHNMILGTRRHEVGYSPARLAALCDEHTSILEAIKDRDPDRAGRLAYEHAKSCTDDLVDRILQAEEKRPVKNTKTRR
jgi:DNA-binding GntR family transcriptional regulator